MLKSALAQSPQRGRLKELKERRTLNSKTFHNPRNNTFTTRISAGYLHYRGEDGKFKELNTNLRPNRDGSARMDRGFYQAQFASSSSQTGRYDVTYELPRPVRGRAREAGRGRGPVTRLQWKVLSLGYFDEQSKAYSVIWQAQPVAVETAGKQATYPGIFPGVDVRFSSERTNVKEEVVLSQSARDNLPAPSRFGIAEEHAFLMLAVEFMLTPNSIMVFARKPDGSREPVKRNDRFSYEGEDVIEFEDDEEVLQFFFPVDFAAAEGDSGADKQVVQRYFYTDQGKHFLLAGVPWSWLASQPAGEVVIDPTTAATTTEDVWLEGGDNNNSHDFLIVGNTGGVVFPKKRTLIRFDVAGTGLPSEAMLLKAQMKLRYYTAVLSGSYSWIDRPVQAHQLLVDWDEAEADFLERQSGVSWTQAWGGIDGTDAKATPESSVLIEQDSPRWLAWDLTALTKQWLEGSAANHGVILWATNEDTEGYDLRFHSSEASSVYDQPYLEIIWTQPTKTVYFLKDHLGSIRATVDDIGQVVGYDDYDPWGYILVGRSMSTGASTVPGAAKNKFTGKEWDDEFGLDWNYFGARYYDPEVGRWFSPDPLASQYPSYSPYAYALDNPIKLIDPNGMEVRGDSASIEAAAALVNEALKDKNIDATARRASRQVKRGFWEKLFSLDFSDTKKVHFLKLEGEGWEALNASDPKLTVEQNEMATEAFSMLKDLVEMEDVLTFHWTDKAPDGASLSKGYSGGLSEYPDVYVSPEGNRTLLPRSGRRNPRYGEPIVGIFFHEVVGHVHPNSYRASLMNVIFGYGEEVRHKESGLTFTRRWKKAPIGK